MRPLKGARIGGQVTLIALGVVFCGSAINDALHWLSFPWRMFAVLMCWFAATIFVLHTEAPNE